MGRACPSCGSPAGPDARFCAQCGGKLERTCDGCGEPLEESVRFCSSCGQPARPQAAEREARKVISALFADVVGSTVLGESMDPEDFTEVVGEAVARMATAVEEFGGSVSELAGDGLLALFGAPAAHEDDPERAVRAGLAIVERIGAYAHEVAAEWGIEGFAVRVGIETGLAVLGQLGGGGKVEYGAMGDALNTAARLQAAAEPKTVLVGPRTHRAVASVFEWGRPLELRLKGKAEPVTARAVTGERERRARGPEPSGMEAEVVGRERELSLAREAIADAVQGAGAILLITGEAGVGKTRLMREARSSFLAAGTTPETDERWLEGRCVSYGENLPYHPFRALLRDWLGVSVGAEAAELGTALRAATERLLGEEASRHHVFLGAVLGVEPSGPEEAQLRRLTPEARQERTFDAVLALIAALTSHGPLAVSIDDLHWADATSLSLVGELLALTEETALLLVLCARPERDHPVWELRERACREQGHRTRELVLEPLRGEDDRALLAGLIGAQVLPEPMERRVLERAEGNPFYLEEIVRSLVDAGALVREPSGWRFDRDVPVEIPETVEKVVLARIDRLSASRHDVLAAAAVLGRHFSLGVLKDVADSDQVDEALRQLQQLDLIRQAGRWPEPEYRFKHALIQEAAYGALLRRRREELHRRAAGALERRLGDRDDLAGVLAHHFHAAGAFEQAFHHHVRAASAAEGVYALEEALDHLGGALAAAAALGHGAEDGRVRELYVRRGRLRFDYEGDLGGSRADLETAIAAAQAAGDTRVEIDGLVQLSAAFRSLDWRQAVEHLEKAVEVARLAGDVVREVNALSRLSIVEAVSLKLDGALTHGTRALELATAIDGDEQRARALDALKLGALLIGDLDRLDELCAALTELHGGAAAAGGAAPMLGNPAYLAWVLLEWSFVPAAAGRWDEAAERIDQALKLILETAHRAHVPLFLETLCRLHRSRGDYGQALEKGRQSVVLAREAGIAEWLAWTDATLGSVLLDLRAPGPAIERLEEGLDRAEQARAPARTLLCSGLLAWARVLAGDAGGARQAAARAEDLLAGVSLPAGCAYLHGADGQIALARAHLACGDSERAARVAVALRDAARAARWHEHAAVASVVAGEALLARGDAEGARREGRTALAAAEEVGLLGVAREAHALLARTGGGQAGEHADRARAGAHRIAEGLDDDVIRDAFLERAESEITAAPASRATS